MPGRRINPVRPRRLDEREYEKRIRTAVLNPAMRGLRSNLSYANSIAEALRIIATSLDFDIYNDAALSAAGDFTDRVSQYHLRRMLATFRSALGVDIRPLLQDTAIQPLLRQRIAENVDLIKSIPARLHQGLTDDLIAEALDAPFDRARLSKLLENRYRTSGSATRRIARDQTTKLIGQLTEVRHRQATIAEYRWSTSGDERVRPTHVANNGKIFRWDTAPPTGHPGAEILCRCVAIPIIPADGVPSL